MAQPLKNPPSTSISMPASFGPAPKESPDILLSNFLRGYDIMLPTADQISPQNTLKEILNDPRWTRRMLEDWFKKGAISKQPHIVFTPDPEFRALYLVLLSKLEETGREKSGLGVAATSPVKEPITKEEKEAAEKDLNKRIIEHFKNMQGR